MAPPKPYRPKATESRSGVRINVLLYPSLLEATRKAAADTRPMSITTAEWIRQAIIEKLDRDRGVS